MAHNLQSSTSSPAPKPSACSPSNTFPSNTFPSEDFRAEMAPDFTDYFFHESLQDYYTSQDLDKDFIANGSLEFYEIQNYDQTQPSPGVIQETYKQDCLPIPKMKPEEPSTDLLLIDNGYKGAPTASRGTRALSNIPTATIVKHTDLEEVKLQPDSPCGIDSKAPSISEGELVYPSNPPEEPTKKGAQESPQRAQTNPKTKRRNRRHENITAFDPTTLYEPLLETPATWSSPHNEFQYNKFGELNTQLKLTQDQMLEFLYLHPLHNLDGDYNQQNGALTLWIQTVPADSIRRYPSMGSDKCRFAECPAKNNTIHKGFFRVAIDEHNRSGIKVDPFHCAGFVHLYCLEKFINFPLLCKDLNVRPDNRLLVEPKNKMAITRDHNELYKIAEDFIKNSQNQPTWDYTNTLSYKLVMAHLELEPDSRSRKRKITGGNHLDSHRGDVEVFAEAERKKYASRKRCKKDLDEEHNVGDQGESDNQGGVDNQDHNPRPHKRQRS
jgi:hypothetical protein